MSSCLLRIDLVMGFIKFKFGSFDPISSPSLRGILSPVDYVRRFGSHRVASEFSAGTSRFLRVILPRRSKNQDPWGYDMDEFVTDQLIDGGELSKFWIGSIRKPLGTLNDPSSSSFAIGKLHAYLL